MLDGEGEAARAAEVGAEIAEKGVADVTESAGRDAANVVEAGCGGGLSFLFTTKVATQQGEQAIGTLKVGEEVWAYNPTTKKMEVQPILHVWINHDNDLVDLTITKTTHGNGTKPVSEVIHTNKKHPFLTVEKGFLPVGQMKLGMHVVEADGQLGMVSGWKVIPGVKTMYNLEVAQDHTYTVGVGQWVVHNSDCGGFKVGISPDEIRDINSSLGGSVELTGTAESAVAAAEHYTGFWNKAAVLVRNIAGSHLFNDANKRTASTVVETLMDRNNIMTGVSEGQMQNVILQVARGELREVPDIAKSLRGF